MSDGARAVLSSLSLQFTSQRHQPPSFLELNHLTAQGLCLFSVLCPKALSVHSLASIPAHTSDLSCSLQPIAPQSQLDHSIIILFHSTLFIFSHNYL